LFFAFTHALPWLLGSGLVFAQDLTCLNALALEAKNKT
jgi:hypothetical protein